MTGVRPLCFHSLGWCLQPKFRWSTLLLVCRWISHHLSVLRRTSRCSDDPIMMAAQNHCLVLPVPTFVFQVSSLRDSFSSTPLSSNSARKDLSTQNRSHRFLDSAD